MGTALLKYKYSSTYNMMKLSGILLYNNKIILSVSKEDGTTVIVLNESNCALSLLPIVSLSGILCIKV